MSISRGILGDEEAVTGFCLKLNKRKKFQRRFLVLSNHFLAYYKDSNDYYQHRKPQKPHIDMKKVLAVISPSQDGTTRTFMLNRKSIDIHTPQRTLTFVCTDNTNMETTALFRKLERYSRQGGIMNSPEIHVMPPQPPIYSNNQPPIYSNDQPPKYSNDQPPKYSNDQPPKYSNDQLLALALAASKEQTELEIQKRQQQREQRRRSSILALERAKKVSLEDEELSLAKAISKLTTQQKQYRRQSSNDAAAATRQRRTTSLVEQEEISRALALSREVTKPTTPTHEKEDILQAIRMSQQNNSQARIRRRTTKEEEEELLRVLAMSENHPDVHLANALKASKSDQQYLAAVASQPKGMDDNELIHLGIAASQRSLKSMPSYIDYKIKEDI